MRSHLVTGSIVCLSVFFCFSTATPKELRMIAPNIPPHFDKNGDGRIGDVIKATLKACGYGVSFAVVPFSRHWKDYVDNEDFDGLATAEADQRFPGYATKPFIHLQDGATVLKGSGLESVESVEELRDKRVVAFPNADRILGIELSVPKFGSFKERGNRLGQLRMLFSGRADAILADGLITANFIALLRNREAAAKARLVDASRPIVFRRIFSAGPQRLYFRDQRIARDFDRCFRALLENGTIERITNPYVDRYREVLGDQYPNY